MIRTKMRKGIAMIELIFALVVMAIAMMAAPELITTATKGGLISVVQEGIAASSAEIGMILTRDWDEASTDETAEGPILIVNNGHTDLEMILGPDGNSSGRRAGTPTTSSRKSFTSTGNVELPATLTAAFEAEGDSDDIDDFNTDTIVLTGTRHDNGDLADTSISLNSTVTYISDTPSAGSYNSRVLTFNNPFDNNVTDSTNIKSVTVQMSSGNLDTSIKLQAFSCNIGTYTLKMRSF